MKKIKYLLASVVLLGLTTEISDAAMATALQEARVSSRRLVSSAVRCLSTAASLERELASIGKSRNPTGKMDIPVRVAVHVDWEEQIAMGPMFGTDPSSKVVSVERIPGVGVFGLLEPEKIIKKKRQ